MLIALWIVTGLLALMFGMAGTMKATRSREAVREHAVGRRRERRPAEESASSRCSARSASCCAATGILPWLTPVAAFALAITMVFAVALHVKRKESFVPRLVLGIVALVVGVGWVRSADAGQGMAAAETSGAGMPRAPPSPRCGRRCR